MVQDGDRAFIFGFNSIRETFSQLGFLTIPDTEDNLGQCADKVSDLLQGKAIMTAMTLTPEDVSSKIPENLRADPATERNIAMILTAVRQAVIKHANDKKAS